MKKGERMWRSDRFAYWRQIAQLVEHLNRDEGDPDSITGLVRYSSHHLSFGAHVGTWVISGGWKKLSPVPCPSGIGTLKKLGTTSFLGGGLRWAPDETGTKDQGEHQVDPLMNIYIRQHFSIRLYTGFINVVSIFWVLSRLFFDFLC